MISQPTNTLVEDYTWFAPFDPAFRQPPEAPDGASPAAIAAHEKAIAEHAAAWNRAVETGNYDAVTIPGFRPTAFVLRHLSGMRKRKLYGAMLHGVSNLEVDAALVRACVVSIQGPDYRPKTTTQYGIELATEELVDWLDAAHPQLVGTMALAILKKAGAPGK